MPYYINTKKFQRIWFSANPQEFLGLENELAMIRLIEKNPGAKITLVYSAKCLNPENKSRISEINLIFFCKKHKIDFINFDTFIDPKDEKVHANDRKFFLLAQKEIDLTLSKQGGNFAAASDYARLIVPLIEIAGNYSDFDTEVNFSSLPPLFQVKEPVVFPIDGETMSLNNDFIAVSVNPKDPQTLAKDAIERLRLLQTALIERAAHFCKKTLMSDILGNKLKTQKIREAIIHSYFKNTKEPSPQGYRDYLHKFSIRKYYKCFEFFLPGECDPQLATDTEKQVMEKLGNAIYNMKLEYDKPSISKVNLRDIAERDFKTYLNDLIIYSVAAITGAHNYYCLYNDIKGRSQVEKISLMTFKIHQCGLKANALDKFVLDQETKKETKYSFVESLTGKIPYPMVGQTNDAAWTPLGAMKKAQREQIIRRAGKKILLNFKARKGKGSLMDLKAVPRLTKQTEEKKTFGTFDTLG